MKPILFNIEMVRAILDGRKTVTRRVVKPQPDRVYSGGNVELRCHTDGPHKGEWHCYRESPPLDKVLNSPWGGQIIPPVFVGDILYVRETWNYGYIESSDAELSTECWFEGQWKASDELISAQSRYYYKAGCDPDLLTFMKWRPSIHMPKEAARIFLRVTDVRAERLHDMTEDDVCAEGAEKIINSCEHMDFSVEPPEPCYNASPCKDCIIDYSYPELFGKMVWDSTIKKNDLARYGWEANPWVWVIEFERMGRDSL